MSRVIKAGAPLPRVVVSNIFEVERDARNLLEEAHSRAAEIRAQAEREGREQGLASVTELLVAARIRQAQSVAHSAKDLQTLAVHIAEKVLGRELALSPHAIADVVAEALTQAGQSEQLIVRVNSADLDALAHERPRLQAQCKAAIEFRADDSVARGGCMIETEVGMVDARLASQLEAIERAIKGEM